MGHPTHTSACFDMRLRRKVLGWLRGAIAELEPEAMVVCGQSGLILGGILSDQLEIPLIAVRKSWEKPRGDAKGAVHSRFPDAIVLYRSYWGSERSNENTYDFGEGQPKVKIVGSYISE